jgi:hypothetical protein
MKGQRGNALVGAVVFLYVLGIFGGAFVQFVSFDFGESQVGYRDAQVFWLAEAALSHGMAKLTHMPNGQMPLTVSSDTGEYRATFRGQREPGEQNPRWRITAWVASLKESDIPLCSLTVLMKGRSATSLPWLEDHSGDRFYTTGDTIDGPVHTNTRFGIAGSPVFLDSIFEMGNLGGFITNSQYPPNPILLKAKISQGDIYKLDHMAQEISKVPSKNRLTVQADQIVDITFTGRNMEVRILNKFGQGIAPPVATRPIPKEGGFYVNGDVQVHGVIDNKLTVGASGNILITDDLVYAGSDPVTGKPQDGGTAFLALIAQQNVQVRQIQAREQAGRGIRINAAIVAMDSSFEVINMRANNWDMGVMTLWGTVAQVSRGQIGAIKGNDSFRGFHKSWHFDRRLLDVELPYFPPLVNQTGMMQFTPVRWGPFTWMERNAV